MAYFDKYGVEFSDDRKTLVKCPKDFKGEYIIPEGVITIADSAFFDCTEITSIIIPDSVKKIGTHAFANCEMLPDIKLPDSVEIIGYWPFAGCDFLHNPIFNSHTFVCYACIYKHDSYTIPDGIKKIANSAFQDSNLKEIRLPNGLEEIGEIAFKGCRKLQGCTIPASLKRIGNSAFAECENIGHIIMSEGVESIGDYAFKNCRRLRNIRLPQKSITHFGTRPFDGCWDLHDPVYTEQIFAYMPKNQWETYVIPDGIRILNDYAFEGSYLTKIKIPDSVEVIGKGCFESCTSLREINIPKYTKHIKDYAFVRCKNLTKIVIPDSVETIGNYAFCNCFNLNEVILGRGLTLVGRHAFDILEGSVSSKVMIGSMKKLKSQITRIEVPKEKAENYCHIEGLKDYAVIINNTIREKQKKEWIEEQQMQELLQDTILFFDAATNGRPRNYNASISDSSNWPRLVQLAWIMADDQGNIIKQKSVIIKPQGFTISSEASAIHGITTDRAEREGFPLPEVLNEFLLDVSLAKQIVGHNIDFDKHVVGSELYRLEMDYAQLVDKSSTCTMKSSTDYCAIPNPNGYFGYKWPSLQELYHKLFNRNFDDAHDALADITATKDCYYELKRRGVI